MDKQEILAEIRRTAEKNGGKPLGRRRFFTETGIREWIEYWVRWSDAVREAGYLPNQLVEAIPDEELLGHLAALARELGHFPVHNEVRMKARNNPAFPSHNTFQRLGNKATRVQKVAAYCDDHGDWDDVLALCQELSSEYDSDSEPPTDEPAKEHGFVYLMKSGRYYKIGMTKSVANRERQLGILLLDPIEEIHSIRTDDPAGIEKYWHQRFADRRKGGEWFALSKADVSAFRRRKFM